MSKNFATGLPSQTTAPRKGAATAADYPVGVPDDGDRAVAEPAASEGRFGPLLRTFRPISLQETIDTAAMLQRQENKYVLDAVQLAAFLEDLRHRFAVLEIDGRRVFSYSSCYFDDDHKCYYDHLQGKRLRFKARTRRYVDTGDIYFEVKLKDKRGATNKQRIATDEFRPAILDEESKRLIHEAYGALYRKEFAHDLHPSVVVNYKRVTLVAGTGGERMTIDFCLEFKSDDREPIEIGDNFIIVETKSANGRGIADNVLKEHGIRSIRYCSKYCIGEILLGRVQRYNAFRRVIRIVLDRIPFAALRTEDVAPSGAVRTRDPFQRAAGPHLGD